MILTWMETQTLRKICIGDINMIIEYNDIRAWNDNEISAVMHTLKATSIRMDEPFIIVCESKDLHWQPPDKIIEIVDIFVLNDKVIKNIFDDENIKDNFQIILDSFVTHAEISFCGKSCSDSRDGVFEVNWSVKGRGLGTYTFFQDKQSGKWMIDNECDSRVAIKEVLCKLIDELPLVTER